MGRRAVRITADTNVLLRAAMCDDPGQAAAAMEVMRAATLVAVPSLVLCEFAWVLKRAYKLRSEEVGEAIRRLIAIESVRVDRPAVEAGLAILDAGGDFADGVIAFEGARMGGTAFATFDRAAASLLAAAGMQATLLMSAG